MALSSKCDNESFNESGNEGQNEDGNEDGNGFESSDYEEVLIDDENESQSQN